MKHLWNDGDIGAEVVQANLRNVHVVDEYASFRGFDHSEECKRKRALS